MEEREAVVALTVTAMRVALAPALAGLVPRMEILPEAVVEAPRAREARLVAPGASVVVWLVEPREQPAELLGAELSITARLGELEGPEDITFRTATPMLRWTTAS